jgi:hypothetical protein
MMANGCIMGLDIGKRRAKISLWNEAGASIARRSGPNRQTGLGDGLTLDVGGTEHRLEVMLKQFAALGPIEAVIPVGHGAGPAVIRNGFQCVPINDDWCASGFYLVAHDKQLNDYRARWREIANRFQ